MKFNLEPMGSGPYRLVSWQKGVRATLEANEGYWRGKPAIKRITFQPVPDASTRIADLRTGKADIARGLNADEAAVIKNDSQLQILSIPTERIGYLFVNALWGPTKDVRVRRAIAYALDRGLIIEALLGGYGRPVDIMLTPANFGYMADIKGHAHDLARAKALVKEAGAEGAELPLHHLAGLRPAHRAGDPADARRGRAEGDDLDERPGDLPAPAPGPAAGRRQPLDRALVLRLPGRGRRDHAAVPQRQHLGEVQQPGL